MFRFPQQPQVRTKRPLVFDRSVVETPPDTHPVIKN